MKEDVNSRGFNQILFFVVVCFMVTPVNTQSAMIDQDFFKLEYMNLSSSF